jgi:hypothetical protein
MSSANGLHGGVEEFQKFPERSKNYTVHLLNVSRRFTTTCSTNQTLLNIYLLSVKGLHGGVAEF